MCLGGGGANYHTLFCIVKNEYYGVCQSRIHPRFLKRFVFLLFFCVFLLGFCWASFCVFCPMLMPVALDGLFLMATSVLSNVHCLEAYTKKSKPDEYLGHVRCTTIEVSYRKP